MNFLAADIGGTYTRLLLGETCAGGWRWCRAPRMVNQLIPGENNV